MRDCN